MERYLTDHGTHAKLYLGRPGLDLLYAETVSTNPFLLFWGKCWPWGDPGRSLGYANGAEAALAGIR